MSSSPRKTSLIQRSGSRLVLKSGCCGARAQTNPGLVGIPGREERKMEMEDAGRAVEDAGRVVGGRRSAGGALLQYSIV